MENFDGKVVLITGASGGIGKATANLFKQRGAIVICADKEIATLDSQTCETSLMFIDLDVTSQGDWLRASSFIKERFGRLDVLINNAGITGSLQNGEQTPLAFDELEWNRVFSVNVTGVMLGVKYMYELLCNSEYASIINISSAVVARAAPNAIAYSASKAALENVTKCLTMFFANENRNIRCAGIRPGATLTQIWGNNLSEEYIKEISKDNPMKRMCTPDEVANLICFLASSKASYINGESISIDGGYSIK